MSRSPTSRSADLTKLVEDGFSIEIRDGHLLVHGIPYVTTRRAVATGVLVCPLDQAGDSTVAPSSHVMDFTGSVPCDRTGQPLTKIQHAEGRRELLPGLFIERRLKLRTHDRPPDAGRPAIGIDRQHWLACRRRLRACG